MMIETNETVGQRLKKLRQINNYTQKQISDYLGYNQVQITKLESDEQTLKVSALDKLCDLYNCSEDYIVYGLGEYSANQFTHMTNMEDMDLKTIVRMNKII